MTGEETPPFVTITVRGKQGAGKSLTCTFIEQAFQDILNGEPPRTYDDEGPRGQSHRGQRLHPQQYEVLKNTHFHIRTEIS